MNNDILVLISGISADTPQVSYIKVCFHFCRNIAILTLSDSVAILSSQAIDVWMNACTAFIFAALIEFTFVNYWYRKQTGRLGSGGGGGGGGGGYNPVYGGREGDANGDGIEMVSW